MPVFVFLILKGLELSVIKGSMIIDYFWVFLNYTICGANSQTDPTTCSNINLDEAVSTELSS